MKDGVVRVLPALVQQSGGTPPLVLDKPVAVQIAIAVDPSQGGLHVGPERFQKIPVAAALIVCACEQNEKRRGVDTAVVAAKGHLFQRGHLPVAGFVEDFARFGVLVRNDLRGLRGGQVSQHAAGQPGTQPQALQRGDDPVATERRIEPGHARVRIRASGQFGGHHVQVGCGPIDPGIDQAVGRVYVTGPGVVPFHVGLGLATGLIETDRHGDHGFAPAGNLNEKVAVLLRSKRQVETGCCGRQQRRPRLEVYQRAADHVVQAAVAQHDAVLAHFRRQVLAVRVRASCRGPRRCRRNRPQNITRALFPPPPARSS